MRKIEMDAFCNCRNLRAVWVEDGCALDTRKHVGNYVAVLPTVVMIGNKRLRDLRQFKEVIIPEGVEKIGDHWFSRSDI